jgi:hypothetical protein
MRKAIYHFSVPVRMERNTMLQASTLLFMEFQRAELVEFLSAHDLELPQIRPQRGCAGSWLIADM